MILRIQKSTREHSRFYVLLTCLMMLLMIRYGLQIGIPRIVLTGTVALIALMSDRDEILAIAIACIPLHEAVDFFIALVACAGVFVLKHYRSFRINISVCLVLLLIVWELLHCFTPAFSISTFLVSVVPLIFLAVILCANVADVDYGLVVRTLALVAAAMCIILLTNLIVQANFNVVVAIDGLRRLGLIDEADQSSTMLGTAINPNALGIICVLSTTGLMQLRIIGQGRRTDSILLLILLVFGTLTSSRTFLACLLIMAVFLVLGQPGSIRRKLRLLCALMLFGFVALILLTWLFPDVLEYYIKRFQEQDITTGRDRLMVAYHEFIFRNPDVMVFGIGLHEYGYKLLTAYRAAGNLPHNGIQEIIVAWGFPGLILFGTLLLMIMQQARKYNRRPILLNHIPLLIILAKSMAGQFLTSNYTILALSYAYLSLTQDFTGRNVQNS